MVLDPTPRKNGRPGPISNICKNHGNKTEGNVQHNEDDDVASVFNGCPSNQEAADMQNQLREGFQDDSQIDLMKSRL